ncbi:uncharacterized protein SPAPADRAFT_138569 [Spathaspora passalidarum NRRL Y-27907]|uniref:FIST domain-containing protein n=1 Tax=Spathaspora passalidarum (strain NRRL Y-27907 / 11-Y1) TaxID=619300 RepID=G3ANG8_SPAPN|nr:uncharacterized protein SPAPADRAFT_138569 [Spathaspora passalidarum NRRL Y-27907]EGW31957.1 hypothetical protein SPAPADRAFT_138569 [Spathaspora passalidarum NRRL Y-27907]
MTIRLFVRQFGRTGCRHLYTKTTINPIFFNLEIPNHIRPTSALVLSTPSNLPQVIQNAIDLYQKHNLQIIVAGVDSIVPNSSRNGVSEVWTEQPLTIENSLLLSERDDLNKPPKESDGIHIVTAKKNWKNIESNLRINFNTKINADLKLANTIFSTGSILTLFYFQPGNLIDSTGNSGQHLCELEVTLPQDSVSEECQITFKDNWTPLYPDQVFSVTNCIGNLVKAVDNKPASEFLEKNQKLMSIGSKETQVYVKLTNPNSTVTERFKIIAGGGGWGAKANMIALSPEAKPVIGSKIEFFMITPQDRYSKKYEAIEDYKNAITLQTTYEEQNYVEEEEEEQEPIVMENVVGCGSESGFKFNGVIHNSPGEQVQIHI